MEYISFRVTAGVLFSIILFFTPLATFAQETCGHITTDDGFEAPIEDCSNPFNADNDFPYTSRITIDGEVVVEDTEIIIEPEALSEIFFELEANVFFANAELYFHNGENYEYQVGIVNGGTRNLELGVGTYSFLVVVDDVAPMPVYEPSFLQDLFTFFVPQVHAFYQDRLSVQQVTFTVVEKEPQSEIDPLILQFEPILKLHPDEFFQPMQVEPFVESSALWSTEGVSDTLVKSFSEIDPVTIEDIAVGSDSADWYLAFSLPDESKAFDVDIAREKYEELVDKGAASPTYYAYKMEDSYTDSLGETHEFIILQYWYFYAFNDWQAHGGFNNHEGDWESVMVFLDKATEEPEYVAYSAHHNDGDPNNLTQYDSVRRNWDSDEIEKDGYQAYSFVALGSHANYPNNGDGVHKAIFDDDLTSIDGPSLTQNQWGYRDVFADNSPIWLDNYEGQWGTDANGTGAKGPQGPNFIAPFLGGGVARFHEPIQWAGIDKVIALTVDNPTTIVSLTDQLISFIFDEVIDAGTSFLVSLHDEVISFGENISDMVLLPHFWDIESNLVNDTFEVQVNLGYDPLEVEELEVSETELGVFFYNEATGVWESVDAVVNTDAHTVSFVTSHFSRYAIGIKQETTIEELYEKLETLIQSSSFSKREKRNLIGLLNIAEKLGKKPKKISKVLAFGVLKAVEVKIERGERRDKLESEIAQKMLDIIDLMKSYLVKN